MAIFVGPARRPWSPDELVTSGLGGSETAAVRIAEALHASGYETSIYAEGPDCRHGGVPFWHWRRFDPALPRTAVLSWRVPEFFDHRLTARVRMLWSAEAAYGPRLNPARASGLDAVLALSAWHERNLRLVYPFLGERVIRTRTGIDHVRFGGPQPRRRKRVLYTSAPNRGLDVLLDLWPRVRAAVPKAQLAYTYAAPYVAVAGDEPGHPFGARIRSRMPRAGVANLGTVPGKEYPRLLRESLVWVHPSWSGERDQPFVELSCIAALEAQAAGLHVVASAAGALPETVRCGEIVRGMPPTPEWEDAFVAAIVAGLTDRELQAHAQREGPRAVADLDWPSAAADIIGVIEGLGPASRSTVVTPLGSRSRAGARRLTAARRHQDAHVAAAAAALALLASAANPASAAAAPTAAYNAGTITITGTAGEDRATVNCQGGVVQVIAEDPNDNLLDPAPNCNAVIDLDIFDTLGGADIYRLTDVTAALGFTDPAFATTGTSAQTGAGNDTLFGSGFKDRFNLGSGADSATAAGGFDTLEAVFPPSGGQVDLTPAQVTFPGTGTVTLGDGFEFADIDGQAGPDTLNASTWTRGLSFSGMAGDDGLSPPFADDPNSPMTQFDAGSGNADQLVFGGDFNFAFITGTLVQRGPGRDIAHSGVERMDVTGGPGANFVDAFLYPGSIDFDALGGRDGFFAPGSSDPNDAIFYDGGAGIDGIDREGEGDFVLTNTSFTGAGSTVQVAGVEGAGLFGSDANDSFDAAAFSGNVFMRGFRGMDTLVLPTNAVSSDPNDASFFDGGADSDLLRSAADTNFTLTDTRLDAPVDTELVSVEGADLSGGPSANTLDASAFTFGGVTLHGLDGDDNIIGTPGIDTLFGDVGNDTLATGAGAGPVFGGAGLDDIRARNGVANEIDCGNDLGNVVDNDPNDLLAGCLTAPPVVVVTPPPPPPPISIPRDVLAPLFNVTVPRTLSLSGNTVTFTIACDRREPEDCVGDATLRTANKVALAAAKKIQTLGKAKFRIAPGTKKRVRIKLSRKALALVRRRALKVKLTVVARDKAGNRKTVTRSATLKAKPKRKR